MARRGNRLAIGLLAIGLVGCGGGEKEAADGNGGGDPATANGERTPNSDGPKVDAGPGPKVVVPAKPVPGAPDWMKYVGPQHISATVVHPKRILQSKLIAALPEGLDLGETRKNVGFDIRHTERLLILGHPPTEKQMLHLRENLEGGGEKTGAFTEEFETGGPDKAEGEKAEGEKAEGDFDEQEFEKGSFDESPAPAGQETDDVPWEEAQRQRAAEPPGIGDATFVVWLDQPVDREQYVAARAAAHYEEPHTIDVDGHEATQVGNREAILFLDDTTVLVGPIAGVRELLAARQAAGPLAARLAEAGTDYDALVVVNLAGREEMLKLLVEALRADGVEVPENLADLPAAAQRITEIVGRVDVSAEGTLATLHVTAADAAPVAVLADSAGKGLDLAKGLLAFVGFSAPPEAREGLQLATATLNGVTIEQQEKTVVVTVPRPDGLVAFVEGIAPQILAAREAARQSVFRGHLKQIGIAIHSFHESYGHAPASAAYATDDGKPLLSWRVALLPMLDENAMFNQIDKTQPWDGPENKAILEQMPEVYKSPGVDDPTLTTLMLLTGPTTIFHGRYEAGNETLRKGPHIRNITDGTTNTILAVYAAPEKAVPWTKPQDLVFDPEKPLESIGEIPETGLLVLMWDASLHTLPKDVAADLFRNLVEHQDGNVVDLP
jgi:hypothetical protein